MLLFPFNLIFANPENIMGKETTLDHLPLLSFHHISLNCKSVSLSTTFYQKILGFQPSARKPSPLASDNTRLCNYGLEIHLMQAKDIEEVPKKSEINPNDNRLTFQNKDIGGVENALQEMKVRFKKSTMKEGGWIVEQLFFHDPDEHLIEVYNCQEDQEKEDKKDEESPFAPLVAKQSPSVGALRHFSRSAKKVHCEIGMVPFGPFTPTDIRKRGENVEKKCTCSANGDKKENQVFLNLMDCLL